MKQFVLLKEMDWFGKSIPSGTVYSKTSGDFYYPTIKGARCPHMQLSFYTVLNNPNYFLEIQGGSQGISAEKMLIVWKDGTYKVVEVNGSWEFENDKDWLISVKVN